MTGGEVHDYIARNDELDEPRQGGSDGENWAAATNRHHQESDTSSHLERLPPEMISHVLSSMPNLRTLRSLVFASPKIHAQYRYDRNRILCACLGREVDGFLVDAYANMMSRVRVIGSRRTDEKVTAFLSRYRMWLSETPDLKLIEPGSIRWMVAYQLSVAWPLACSYTEWALDNLRQTTSRIPVATEACNDGHPLSRSEQIRVYRSLYRYETYFHLFGRNRGSRSGGFRHHEINEHFFGLFDPWETEAVGCIEIFVRSRYEEIFAEVAPDLHPDHPRFRQENGVMNPEGSFDLETEYRDYMDGTVSRGLKVTVRLLAIDNEDHDQLVSKMERYLTHNANMDATMTEALSEVAQDDRRQMSPNFPDARDTAQEAGEPMEFLGDAVPPVGPPIAWIHLWNGKYANIYGEYVPGPLRRAGYVMWDQSRWTAMSLDPEGLIRRQWELAPQLVEDIDNDLDWSPLLR